MSSDSIARIKNDLELYVRTGKAAKFLECVKALQDAGEEFQVDALYGAHATLLEHAASRGQPETIKVLLDLGAEVDRPNRRGETALMHAAFKGSLPAVKVLLEAGADPKARNLKRKTALDGALYTKSTEVVALLTSLETQADPIAASKWWATAPPEVATPLRQLLETLAQDGSRGEVLEPGTLARMLPLIQVPTWWEELVTSLPLAGVESASPTPEQSDGDGAQFLRLDDMDEISTNWECYMQPWQESRLFPIAIVSDGCYWVIPSDGDIHGPVKFWDASGHEVLPGSPSFAAWIESSLATVVKWQNERK